MDKDKVIAKHIKNFKSLFDHIDNQFEMSPMTQVFYVHELDKPYDIGKHMIDRKYVRFIMEILERLYGYYVVEKSDIRTVCEGRIYTEEERYINIDLL